MLGTIISGISEGFVWAILALGVYISFRLLDFADLSCEGSITLGASLAAMFIYKGVNPFLATLLAFCGGCIAGSVTAILTTKLKIPPILSGILTMISLYSINIHIMSLATGVSGTANLNLLTVRNNTVYGYIKNLTGKIEALSWIGKDDIILFSGIVFAILIIAILYWFFGTEMGCTIRATGSNEKMCRAQGINTDTTKIIGLAISNGLIALSGAMICQGQRLASEVNMGVGAIVIGLASIIIGETIFMKVKNFALRLLGIVVGSVIYRVVVSVVIFSGMPPADLKLMTAVIVLIALSLPIVKNAVFASAKKRKLKAENREEVEEVAENG